MTMMIPTMLLLAQMACPDHDAHTMNERGDKVMGFSHLTAKHSFKLFDDGGAIEVRGEPLPAIREHLKSIAKSFAAGDFEKPEAIHEKLPDGAKEMQERRAAIRYGYEELPGGARVRIRSSDAEAVDAVHRFLRFQIEEHKTGDTVAVTKEN
jgi:hypothetical protein